MSLGGQTQGRQKPLPAAYDKALGLLARREQSRSELDLRLQRSGYPSDEIDAALRRLAEDGYQDDGRFGEMLVRSRIGQGYGPMRIRAELRSHKIPDALVEALLEAAAADWLVNARDLLRRRHHGTGKPDFAERGKRAQFLLRRGFPAATVRQATDTDLDDADADE